MPNVSWLYLSEKRKLQKIPPFGTRKEIIPATSPRITSRILFCQTSMNSGEVASTWVAFWVHAGHFQSGRESIASEGVKKAKVPPCKIGSLHEVEGGGEIRETGKTIGFLFYFFPALGFQDRTKYT